MTPPKFCPSCGQQWEATTHNENRCLYCGAGLFETTTPEVPQYKDHNLMAIGGMVFAPEDVKAIEDKLNDGLQPVRVASGENFVLLDMQLPAEEQAKAPEGEAGVLMQAIDFIEVKPAAEPGVLPAEYPRDQGWRIFKAQKGNLQLIQLPIEETQNEEQTEPEPAVSIAGLDKEEDKDTQ